MKTAMLFALGLSAAVLSGCGPDFERLDFQNRTTPPVAVTVDYTNVTIPVGIAVGVIATPYAGGDPMDEDTLVELESDDTGVIGADRAIEHGSFVLYGVGAGTANINVRVDGDIQGSIPATVMLQQP